MDCNSDSYFVKHLGVVDSTNSYARANAERLWGAAGRASMVVVYADEQTAGRGQRGNVWQSSAGENLLVSIMVRPLSLPVVSQFALSQAIALAVCRAMEYYEVDTRLKWPNDVYVGSGKLAGILVELDYCGSFVEQAVIGVGLNVNQLSFTSMDRLPVSMRMLKNRLFDVEMVLASLIEAFSHYNALLNGGCATLADEYKKRLIGYNRVTRYRDAASEFEAEIADVAGDGHLLLKRADGGLSQYAFKEVEQLL